MNRFLFISFFIITSISAYSQTDFRSGYYITNSNDTVYGLIDYRSDELNGKVCNFKSVTSDKTTTFLPGTILGYRFTNGKYYVSRQLPNDSTKRIVFLEYLIQGKASIYYLFTFAKQKYFLEKDGILTEMNDDEKILTNNYNDQYAIKPHQYIGILRYYFQDSPSLLQTINNTSFNK